MRPRYWLALLVCGGCASNQPPSTPAPSPGAVPGQPSPPSPSAKPLTLRLDGVYHYALGRRDSLVAQMPSGEAQVQVSGQTAFVTLTLQPADAGARFGAVLDSIVPDPDITILESTRDSLVRTRWTGHVDRLGWVDTITATTSMPLSDQIRGQLQLLFPVLAPDGAYAGTNWSGSATAIPTRLSVVDLNESVEVQASAAETAQADGQRMTPVTIVRTTSGQGSGNQAGQQIDLTATGRDSLVYRLASDGRVLGAEGTSVRDMTLTAVAVGQTVPARQETRLTFELVR